MKPTWMLMLAISGFLIGGCAMTPMENVQWNPTNHLNTANPPQGIMGAAPAAPAQTTVAAPAPAAAVKNAA